MAREAKNLTKIAPSKEINEVDVEFLQNIIKGIVNAGELDSVREKQNTYLTSLCYAT